jgi:preprotein translocase subunit SecF
MSFKQTLKDIYHENTRFRFLYNMKRWGIVSGAMILVSLGFLLTQGLSLGIDFTGGTAFTIPEPKQVEQITSSDVSDILQKEDVKESRIQFVNKTSIRVQTESLDKAERTKLSQTFADSTKQDIKRISIDQVGPTWGQTVSKNAVKAMLVFFVIVALYLTVRFEMSMGISAIFTVLHDIILVAGVYSITGLEVTPATVVALLTILGFSLYDTVVVFDQIRLGSERLYKLKDTSYTFMANKALNSVLMRSINTTIVAILPVLSLIIVGSFLLGAVALLDFAVALLAGLTTGAYSSIFVSAPVALLIKRRQPWVSELETRFYAKDEARLSNEVSEESSTANTSEVIKARPSKKN